MEITVIGYIFLYLAIVVLHIVGYSVLYVIIDKTDLIDWDLIDHFLLSDLTHCITQKRGYINNIVLYSVFWLISTPIFVMILVVYLVGAVSFIVFKFMFNLVVNLVEKMFDYMSRLSIGGNSEHERK